ncbi:tellurium resistance protein TerX [Mucilaginibacter sp. PPCGB 2223]|uniref:TerD family protein n=1 Tax=Mucilaginibacter sp. PPCGB 2223 TaxID=1886027 RepID=UPI000826863C|nr:TerD family protein [Mucilaginibacter sp. PPCGB 2223]OCX52303.1 tellurium resistance protein TerX [Mucilaginibacter sp. PPCGB 2223]
MAINLVKGQTIDLRKNDKGDTFDLSQVTIGLGWDVRQKSGGLLGKLFGGGESDEYDLDAIAFLLNSSGKVANMGRAIDKGGRHINMYEGDVVYFNSMIHPSGHIWLTGDNRTGAGDGDDEQIIVKLDSLEPQFDRIVFVVAIYQGRQNHQHFGMVENAFIRAVDARGREIARFSLSGDATFNGMCAMTFAEVYRRDGTWKFRALGEPHPTDNFVEILKQYT